MFLYLDRHETAAFAFLAGVMLTLGFLTLASLAYMPRMVEAAT